MKRVLIFISLILTCVNAIGQQTQIDVKTAVVRNWIIYQGDTLAVIRMNGDSIFYQQGVTVDTVVIYRTNYWTLDGSDNISNNNAGDVTLNGQVFAPDIAASGSKYSGNVAGIGLDDRLFPKSIIDLYNEQQDSIRRMLTPAIQATWIRDTTKAVIYLARSTDKVGIGTDSPAEQLELTGNLRLPVATATTGIIKKGSNSWLRDFKATGTTGENIWMGTLIGNTTLTGSDAGDEGSYNLFFGDHIGQSLTTGYGNIAMGHYAAFGLTSGNNNISIGNASFQAGTSAIGNIAIGQQSLKATTSNYNVGIGQNAMKTNTTGYENTALGANSLDAGTTPYQMVAVGKGALSSVTYGYASVAIGVDAMGFGDTAITNVAVGNSTLSHSRYACNVAVGNSALKESIYALDNVAVGSGALMSLKAASKYGTTWTGSENVGIGVYVGDSINYSGEAAGTGTGNVLIGHYVMRRGRTINKNVAIGWFAGFNNISGDSNVYIGNQAGYSSTGSHNVFIGDRAGYRELGNHKFYLANNNIDISDAVTSKGILMFGDFDSQYINVFNKLSIGAYKTPSYNLDVTGTGFFSDDLTLDDNMAFVGAGQISTTGNGTMTLDVGTGKVDISGDLDYDLSHGYMYYYERSETIALTQNVYTKLTKSGNDLFTISEANGITIAGDSITITRAGDYTLWFNFSGTGAGTNDVYRFKLYKNGAAILGTCKASAAKADVINVWHMQDLAVGDDLSIYLTNTVDSDDITAVDCAIYIRKEHD